MESGAISADFPRHSKSRLRGPTRSIPVQLENHDSTAFQLIVMNARLETKLRNTLVELEEVRKLLDEANAALAEAGVTYEQGNLRERISAYQVFRQVRSTKNL